MVRGAKNMKKIDKIFIILLCALMLTAFCGCDRFHKYKGTDYDLYTVAINSLVGAHGEIFMRPEGPTLNIVETDNYGRTLFYYYEKNAISTHSMIISQKSENGFVFYYEDFNFISKATEQFATEEIDELKCKNDWNMPIDESRLVKKEIVKQKSKNSFNESTVEEQFAKILGEKWELFYFGRELTTSEDGKTIVLAVGIYDRHGESIKKDYVLILDKEGNLAENAMMELTDFYNYQEQLKQFKADNGWYVKTVDGGLS